MKIISLLFLFSCGEPDAQRCYSKDEALNACITDEIRKGTSTEQAELLCEPYYQTEGCYQI